MKLIIDIPEQMYLNAKADTLCGADILVNAIKNGMPLPKGHGDLKDIAEIERLWRKGGYDSLVSALIVAPTVIEADKEVKNDRKDCPYRQEENGNCLPVGGFCLAVTDDHCKYLKEVENDD